MPCRDYMSDSEVLRSDAEELKARLDEVTRLLCFVMRIMEQTNQADSLYRYKCRESGDLEKWWETHKEEDRLARAEEEAKINRENKIRELKERLHESFSEEEIEILHEELI